MSALRENIRNGDPCSGHSARNIEPKNTEIPGPGEGGKRGTFRWFFGVGIIVSEGRPTTEYGVLIRKFRAQHEFIMFL